VINYNRAAIGILFTNQTKLNLPMPAQIDEAHRNIGKITAATANLRQANDVAYHVAQAIIEDRDPTTDPAVARAITAHTLTNYAPGLADEAQNRLVTAIRNNRSDLYAGWKKTVAKAATTLTTEYQTLGNVDLTADAAQILNRGGDIAKHFTAARDANTRIATVIESHNALESILGNTVSPTYRTLWLTPATLDEWERHELIRRHDAWELTTLGLPVDLASPAEIRSRIEHHQTERTRREQLAQAQGRGRVPEWNRA